MGGRSVGPSRAGRSILVTSRSSGRFSRKKSRGERKTELYTHRKGGSDRREREEGLREKVS